MNAKTPTRTILIATLAVALTLLVIVVTPRSTRPVADNPSSPPVAQAATPSARAESSPEPAVGAPATFTPVPSRERPLGLPSAAGGGAAPREEAEANSVAVPANGPIQESALRQIAALQREKATRTPAQNKIDSQLLTADRMRLGLPIAEGVTTLMVDLEHDDAGRVMVDIKARVTDQLLAEIEKLGGRVVNSFSQYQAIRAALPLAQMETLAAQSGVAFIEPAVRATRNVGSVTSEGDVTHKANTARTTFSVTGAGVKVGVLSDSVDHLAASQASGDLGAVTVLPGQAGTGTGEGTAMLEIVHDLAPGAELFFATANPSPAAFADNIRKLRTAGCDIIVDDITYGNESPFQDGVIAQAVNDVAADGALVFSSAANSGHLTRNQSGTWEGDFQGGQILEGVGQFHQFGSVDNNAVTATGGGAILFWANPLGAATDDYDLYILDASGANVVARSNNRQTGSQDPTEALYGNLAQGLRIQVVKYSGNARYLYLETRRGRLALATAGSTRGHNAAESLMCVAAVDVATSHPSAFTGGAKNPITVYSSDGPRRMFFRPDGTPITPGNFSATGGTVLQKPDIAAAAGGGTSVPGFQPFHGTSAAAPHAAAIAALLKSFNPALTAAQIRAALIRSAFDIEASGVDRDSGYGLVMAQEALQTLQAPVPPTLTSFAPTNGNAGTTVTLTGTKFEDVTTVKFNGVNATFTVNSGTQISAIVPTAATTGRITVTTPAGTATSTSDFRVLATPAITSFSPATGAAGSSVVIAGANFSGASGVQFNGVTATFTVNSATQITATVPAAATTGRITVTTPGGTATSSGNFTVSSLPVITSFSPASGGAGTTVTLSGANLSGATSVRFNGVAASFTVNSATQITATVPAGATTGPISVTTPGGTANSASSFVVVIVPAITGFTPSSGPVAAEVVISGQNFSGALNVRFNGTAAYTFLVQSSTQILTVVPAGATTGPISVTTPGGTATSAGSFSVTSRPANDDFANGQVISGTSGTTSGANVAATKETGEPDHGANEGGRSIWYRWTAPAGGSYRFDTAGSDFDTLLGVYTGTAVSNLTLAAQSDDVSATNRTSSVTILANSGTTYRIAVDGHTHGLGGATNDTYGAVVLHWVNLPSAPVVTGFQPTTGLAGTPVVITGANFSGATAVLFGGVSAPFTINSAGQITATVPPGAITGTITVLTPAGPAASVGTFTVLGVANNDRFADAQLISGPAGAVLGDSLFATKEPGEPFHAGNAGGKSIWYRWIAPSSGLWTFDTLGSDFDTLLGVYTGSTVGALNQEASNDDSTGDRTSSVSVQVVAGTTYRLAVDGYGGAFGNVVLNWRMAAVLVPRITGFSPPSGPSGTQVTIQGANLTGATSVRFGEIPAGFTVNGATQITATVPAGAQTGPISVITPNGRADSATAFVVASTTANDQFVNAQVLSGPVAIAAGANAGATLEPGEPYHAFTTGGRSVWYRWTAPSNGVWTVDLSGSSFDTLLAIYSGGTVNGLFPDAWNDDFGDTLTSRATITALGGVTYRIAVDGYAGANGTVALRLFPDMGGEWVYGTEFEFLDGFMSGFPLAGNGGWTQQGTGGNGIVYEFLPGYGQNAYIGYAPPSNPDDWLFIWTPLDYTPNVNVRPVVRFSVVMNIVDSSNNEYDNFDWQVFNRDTERLFTLNFDNNDLGVYYQLSGSASSYVDTGYTFENDETYTLTIAMDFGANRWNAFLDDVPIVSDQPISVGGLPLTLGDIDAVWAPSNSDAPGDNYMLFDDYFVTAEGTRAPVILLQPQGQSVSDGGQAVFGVVARGEEPLQYQWRRNNTNLPAATGPMLILDGVTALQAGRYSVVVSNLAGSAVSQDATLVVAAPPNLVPWQPAGWSAPLVVSIVTNTTTDAARFSQGQSLYLDWAVANDSGATITNRFYVRLYVDNQLRHEWFADSLAPNHHAFVTDFNLGTLDVGGHVLRLEADTTGVVTEAREDDNTLLKTIVVSPSTGAPPRLTGMSRQPAGPVQFFVSGEAGRTYTIQVSTNLVNWAGLTNVVGATSPIPVSDPDAAGKPRRFYRAWSAAP